MNAQTDAEITDQEAAAISESAALAGAKSAYPDWSRIKRQEETRIKAIRNGANALEGDREACLAAGMNDYVSKPIRVHELVQALLKAERK